ncbi:MAG: ribonuclease P protein component [Erysipelotrichaceae bacterium]|nr:ribonuclease P protein component [Erysipelotrichaceae bacterium]
MKREFRIRKSKEFSLIIEEKHSVSSAAFAVYVSKRKEDHARVGISVSKKLGDAVERNRIKRQVRELAYALIDFENDIYDYVIIVRRSFLNNDFETNKKDLEKLIKKAII